MEQTSINELPCQYCNFMTNAFAYVYWNLQPIYVCVYCVEMMDILTLSSHGHFAVRADDDN